MSRETQRLLMQQQQQLQPFDFHRLLIGQTPGWFLIEIAVRMVLIYLMLMVAMRLMGKRVAAQMSLSEIAVIVTLGAAVGVPMQTPERGILAPLVLLGIAILFQRGLSLWAFRDRKVEVVSQGDVCVVVQDGMLMLKQLEANVLSRERLFSVLRAQGIQHLGQLRRVYLESSGDVSLIKRKESHPGLSVLPTFDDEIRQLDIAADGLFACLSCGYVHESKSKPLESCKQCGCSSWTEAVSAVET